MRNIKCQIYNFKYNGLSFTFREVIVSGCCKKNCKVLFEFKFVKVNSILTVNL